MDKNDLRKLNLQNSQTDPASAKILPLFSRSETDQNLRCLVSQKAKNGNYKGAIAILNQLLEADPDNAIDYNNRGLMYFYNQDYSQAILDYNQAININPKLDSAYNNRANCYVAQGNLAAALKDYETALDLNPRNIQARINEGITFRDLGLYDLAIENFDLCLILSRRLQGRIYGERGYTYYLRGDWNCAIADYFRSLDHLPRHPSKNSYRQKVETWLSQLQFPNIA